MGRKKTRKRKGAGGTRRRKQMYFCLVASMPVLFREPSLHTINFLLMSWVWNSESSSIVRLQSLSTHSKIEELGRNGMCTYRTRRFVKVCLKGIVVPVVN
jgi:hypothetical protein